MKKILSTEKKVLPSTVSLLKVSLCLFAVAIISSTFAYADTASVSVAGTSYDVEYTGNGVLVTSIEADLDLMSLILSVDVTGPPGVLDIVLDRDFFDSSFQGQDDVFFVLADGDETTFSETQTTADSRTLRITLPQGTEDVEIIGSVFGATVQQPPVDETPVEPPVDETPVEPPVDETPVEPPVDETPVEQPTTKPPVIPKETKPSTTCGTGTVLKDGACVIDQRCGTGTILKDGVCVVEPVQSRSFDVKEMGTELVTALIAGFLVAGIVGIILALISKASKSKD